MTQTLKFAVPDMSCAHCKAAVEKAIAETDASARVEVDLDRKTVAVASDLPPDQLARALAEAGYPATAA